MDEFLEKLQEDQRRMRKFLRDNAQRFRDMGALLAKARRKGGRVFVLAEPPLEGVVPLVAEEYLTQLPVIPVDLNSPSPPSVDPDGTDEPAIGRAAAAKQVVRHLHDGDLVLAFLHEGSDRETRRVLEAARARRQVIVAVGGLGAKAMMKRVAKHRVTLPTRGIKTVCEGVLLCSRVIARVSRAAWRQREADDVPLLQVLCDTCNERVFLPETQRGKESACPLCKAALTIPRKSSRRLSLPSMKARGRTESGKTKRPTRSLKPSMLEIPAARLDDDSPTDSPASSPSDLIHQSAGLDSPSPPPQELSAPVGLVSASQEGNPLNVPSFGSGIAVGSDIVSAELPPVRPSERRPTLGTTVSTPADP